MKYGILEGSLGLLLHDSILSSLRRNSAFCALSTILFHPPLARSPPTTSSYRWKKTQPRHWPAGPKGDLTPWMLTKHGHPLESPSACVRTNVWNCTHVSRPGVPKRAHPRHFFSLSLSLHPSLSLSLSLGLSHYRLLGARWILISVDDMSQWKQTVN